VVPDAQKIIGIGLNYRSHVAESAGREPPPFPRVFSRWNDSVVGHGEALLRPVASEQFDYEGELALIIGKPGRHIAKQSAFEHIAGYACFTDGSLRDFDYREVSVARGILEHSRAIWLAADHSKFHRSAMVEVGTLEQIDRLFTDQPPPHPFDSLLASAGVDCVVAPGDFE
jgi:2-keto-4-pentenoate hydratase/2-oxohepta-3-ene-1,7-dioic acid hydratase in catechol pathway